MVSPVAAAAAAAAVEAVEQEEEEGEEEEEVVVAARAAAKGCVIGDIWEVRYGLNIRPIHGRMDTALAIC